uniref:Transmembrane protein n=1 Tax=Sipha flava TaxID=143950 RepID=A0A2S2Q110_9HEMI
MRQCSSSYRMSGLDRRTNVDVQILSAASKAIAEKCFWNACKALSFGLFLMAVGAIMAIIGYYAEQLSSDDIVSKTDIRNSSTSIRTTKTNKKSSHIYKLSYAGPIVMGIGGFIVVAACVMTFEARDRAAKFMSSQLKIMGGGGGGAGTMSGHRGYGRQTPSAGYLSRGDSGRSSYQNPCDLGRHKMNKSPSAPNLAAAGRGTVTGLGRLPLRHKHGVHVVSLGNGRTLLSPHTLRRQAMSMDTQDYSPLFSPPRSRHSSSGVLACTGGINVANNINQQGSRESVNDPRARGSHGSMVLDLHVPNECPVTMRVRDRSRRSDTARRHVLCRQTPVELDDAIIAYAATATADHRQQAKRCTRSATCDVPHAVKSKRRRQDSSSSDVVTRRRSGSPVCSGSGGRGWRSSANDVIDTAEWVRASDNSSVVSSPQRIADHQHQRSAAHPQFSDYATTTQNIIDSKMSLSRTCSDIMSIDKSFEESNYSSS